jgi:hypothetical protein
MTKADNIIAGMVEVLPSNANGFSKIVETLTRMGVANSTEKVLSQTAHILHKQGKYYIAHFKEMMALDGKTTEFTDGDAARRNRIAQMLCDWGLCKIVDHTQLDPLGHPNIVKVVKFSEKDQWVLVPKYTIGVKKI